MSVISKIESFNECNPPPFLKFELDDSDLVVYLDGKLLKEMQKERLL